MDYEVRQVETLDAFHQIEDVQREAWGFADREIVPQSILVAIRNAGGLVLGAFERDDRVGGFCFSFAALKGGEPYHHSHMAAVRPDRVGTGMARALKLEQRRRVMAMGMRRITWTFDPLEARNAAFNLRKLGVIADRYLEDVYGLSSGFIHGGLPTDRIAVRWDLDSPRVLDRVEEGPPPLRPPPGDVPRANETSEDDAGRRVPVAWDWTWAEEEVLVEIPLDIQALKREARLLARSWRMHLREGLPRLLETGYRIEELLAGPDRRPCYLLRRPEAADTEADPAGP